MRRSHVAVVIAACLCAACAGPGTSDSLPQGLGVVRSPSGQPLAPQAAMDTIVIGKSTKTDVSSALRQAIVIPFDNGHEVWVYRWPGVDKTPRTATELVVLFDPAGVVKKARLRPGYPPRD